MLHECVVVEKIGKLKCTPIRDSRKEQAIVNRKLNSTCRRLYWFFKRTSSNGEKQVAIKDSDLINVIKCAQRTLFVNLRLLNHHNVLNIELLSHKGKSRSSPRKLYTFMGINHEEQSSILS